MQASAPDGSVSSVQLSDKGGGQPCPSLYSTEMHATPIRVHSMSGRDWFCPRSAHARPVPQGAQRTPGGRGRRDARPCVSPHSTIYLSRIPRPIICGPGFLKSGLSSNNFCRGSGLCARVSTKTTTTTLHISGPETSTWQSRRVKALSDGPRYDRRYIRRSRRA